MKLGMPTLVKLDTLEKQIILCKELGLEFIELNMNLLHYNTESLKKIDFRKLYQEGLEFTIHLPEEMDLASFEVDIRKAYINIFKKLVNLIPKNTIKKLNMHLHKGVYFTLPDQKIQLYEVYEEKFLWNLYDSFAEILPLLEDKEIDICIENDGGFSKSYIQTALKGLIKHENVYLTWDIGHDASSGYLDTPFFEKYSQKINHIHLHDAIGKRHHLELYTGEIDISSILNLAKKNDIDIVIETKTEEALRNSMRSIDFFK